MRTWEYFEEIDILMQVSLAPKLSGGKQIKLLQANCSAQDRDESQMGQKSNNDNYLYTYF